MLLTAWLKDYTAVVDRVLRSSRAIPGKLAIPRRVRPPGMVHTTSLREARHLAWERDSRENYEVTVPDDTVASSPR